LRVYGAGREYAHVAVDDHSRVAYTEVLADQTGRSAEAFLRIVRWFAQRGTVVTRVLTDNGQRLYQPTLSRSGGARGCA
jgi:hypothetical protein